MSDNSIFNTSAFSDLSIQNKIAEQKTTSKGRSDLDKDVFLELLVTQMSNQNPLEPQENSEFVAQLAQFSSVEGLDNLNNSVEAMSSAFTSNLQSSQVLQASAMVGRSVVVNTQSGVLSDDKSIAGQFEVSNTTGDVTINIYDQNGVLVSSRNSTVNEQGEPQSVIYQPGRHDFEWDGTDKNGEQLPNGTYQVRVIANYDGEAYSLPIKMRANVDSVSVTANGSITLNVAGVGPVSINNVNEIL